MIRIDQKNREKIILKKLSRELVLEIIFQHKPLITFLALELMKRSVKVFPKKPINFSPFERI